jgi:hypothetical protein
VEGSLLELTTVRPIAFFTWNGQTFTERWMRRGLVLVMALLRPFLYAANRVFATRVVHTVLRGVSRDRLDLLGEEYFQYKLKPQLKPEGVRELKGLIDSGADVVLVSPGTGSCDGAAGAASGRELGDCESAGISRWHGDGKIARSGDSSSRECLRGLQGRGRMEGELRINWLEI